MADGQKASAWTFFVGGCLTAIVVLVVAVAAIALLGYRWAKSVESTMKNPDARAAKALEVLGCEKLPQGYYAIAAVSVPYLLDLAVLGDKAPDPKVKTRSLGDRGLVFIRMIRFGKQAQELEDYFAGRTDDVDVLRRHHISIASEEILKRGVIEQPGSKLLYLAQRGSVQFESGAHRGLMSIVLVECPPEAGNKLRLGVWFGPDPAKGHPLDDKLLAGTPGDASAIQAFFGKFKLCGN